jgi:hypothetical protein
VIQAESCERALRRHVFGRVDHGFWRKRLVGDEPSGFGAVVGIALLERLETRKPSVSGHEAIYQSMRLGA